MSDDQTGLAADVAKLWKNRKEADITLTCQGKSFPVHKAILSACSEVFAALIAKGEAKNDIEIKDTNPGTLDIFLSYLYESKLPPLEGLFTDDWCGLIKLANRFNVRCLKTAWKSALLANIQPSQFVQLAIAGYQCKYDDLKDLAITKMKETKGPLRELEGWSKLEGYPALALEIADQMKK